jgi:methyl-accepting chemotaxis protein
MFNTLGGISRAVDIKAFRDMYGLNWLIVDVLNYSELIYSVNQSTMISIIISVLAIVISVVVSLVFGIVITRPLKALSSEMNEIANMNLTPNSTMTFKLDEFNEIADSMSQMKQGLTNFAKFVPQDVVRSMLVRNEVVKLGVTQRVITIMFLDIEG